ncbi:hypothetical protein L7Q78_34280, partial [Achromobacter xylosoxidans]|nr:hypothetical protein [Achromobacter xylosoxidans]
MAVPFRVAASRRQGFSPMQILKPINIGLAPNDQTGDTLRDAMTIANENFAKARAGVEAVEVSTAAAQRKADAALPAAEK